MDIELKDSQAGAPSITSASRYPGDQVDDLYFAGILSVDGALKGGTAVLLEPNGAGKTTTIQVFVGPTLPTSTTRPQPSSRRTSWPPMGI